MASQNKSTRFLPPHHEENFRGYTISELRHQRLIAQVRREFLKEKLLYDTKELTTAKLFPKVQGKTSGLLAIASKGLRILSYADFFTLGMALFRTGRKVYGIFRKK